jgi:signal transduction histidine kinase
LRVGRTQAVLQVEDDGRGEELATPSPIEDLRTVGVGIAGMRARMLQLGGTLTIRSTPKGTVVRAVVPLTSPEPYQVPRPT